MSSFLPCSQALPSVSLTESQLPLLLPPLFFTICSLRISSFLFSTIPLHQQCFLPRWFSSNLFFDTFPYSLRYLTFLTTPHHCSLSPLLVPQSLPFHSLYLSLPLLFISSSPFTTGLPAVIHISETLSSGLTSVRMPIWFSSHIPLPLPTKIASTSA